MKRTMILAIVATMALLIAGGLVMAGGDDIGRIFIGDEEEADHLDDAKITEAAAIAAAEEYTGGEALSVELENEDGYLVYGVHIQTDEGRFDVKVDAGTGEVLKSEPDD